MQQKEDRRMIHCRNHVAPLGFESINCRYYFYFAPAWVNKTLLHKLKAVIVLRRIVKQSKVDTTDSRWHFVLLFWRVTFKRNVSKVIGRLFVKKCVSGFRWYNESPENHIWRYTWILFQLLYASDSSKAQRFEVNIIHLCPFWVWDVRVYTQKHLTFWSSTQFYQSVEH